MTDKQTDARQDSAEQPVQKNESRQLVFFLVVLALLIYWAVHHPGPAVRVGLVLLGFGGIVMIHELGHFIVAKLGGIKVEAFSIGFPPVILGIRKLQKGWRVRFLPKIGEAEELQEGDNDTEYQIGLIPVGGFVKMLGQSDTGAADANDDPRSYANRPVWIRIATVSAGVVFNAIGAVVIFVILFMNGIDLPPAVVGHVLKNSPAYDVGIRPGDKIVAINGDEFVDFAAVRLAPVLSSPGEPIDFRVLHLNETVENIEVVAERPAGDPSQMRMAGIGQAQKLEINDRDANDPNYVADLWQVGLRPGDEIIAVGNKSVSSWWEFQKVLSETFQPEVTIRVSRQWPPNPDSQERTIETVTLPLQIPPTVENFREQYDMAHFASLVPRLQVELVFEPSKIEKMVNWFRKTILRKEPNPTLQNKLSPGDVILKAGNIEYPTYGQLRQVTEAHEDQLLLLTVLRTDKQGTETVTEVTVTPKDTPGGQDYVAIGFAPGLDMESPVVAAVLSSSQPPAEKPEIPAGAKITAVAGQPVQNFYDIASVLPAHAGQTVDIDYQFEGTNATASLTIPRHEPVHAQAGLAVLLPWAELTDEYKADNPAEAVQMGFKKAWQFVANNYVTLTRLVKNELGTSALMGPVGIVSVSYQAAGYDLDRYLYLLGLISTALAVMNLLPLPVLDGGHIVFLLIEKITGKPIHEKVLAPIMYIGLALLLGLILWVSYNDVIRLLFG